MRHGETPANQGGVWHGSIDTPLTPRGRAQASRVARFLEREHTGATALYSSDLRRARDTATPIGRRLALTLRVEPALREYDLGAWEGKTYRELHETHRLWDHMRADPHFAPHGGESPTAVAERFAGALRRIAEGHPGEPVIVVAHGGALSLGLAMLLDGDYTRWTRVMDNGAVSELCFAPDPALVRFNLTSHLEGV